MKTHRQLLTVLTMAIIALSSCTSLSYTTLDVLRPAQVAFAPQAQNLLLINNTTPQPPDVGHKTQYINEKARNIIMYTDSLPLFCLAALKEEVEGKSFFSSVQLHTQSTNSSNDFFKINTLAPENIKQLCETYKADVILCLDRIKVNDMHSEYYYPESASYVCTLEGKYETNWSVYYPNNNQTRSVQFKDTVYWESESYSLKESRKDLPDRADALIDGALHTGKKSVNRFIPYWDKVDRYFFDSHNKLMKQGMDSLYWKNWTAAINYWKKALLNTSSVKLKAYAANNIAIAYEIIGDMDNALQYASQAYAGLGTLSFVDYTTYHRLSEYIIELTQRKKDILFLRSQMGN